MPIDPDNVNAKSITWMLHDYQAQLDWRCKHCNAPYPDDGTRPAYCVVSLTQNVVIHGYYETECGDEGSVFPFHNEHEARQHAEQSGLSDEDLTFWTRAPTDDELEMIRFGAAIALGKEL